MNVEQKEKASSSTLNLDHLEAGFQDKTIIKDFTYLYLTKDESDTVLGKDELY